MIKSVHHPKYRALVKWLISARKRQGLTVRDLAELLNERHSVIVKIETRSRKLSALEYYQYCKALKLEPIDGIQILENTEE
ncbi:helix-turn-helix domain-containing protein [Neptunomonas japonica]|uniref:helix-turn-helix domain-containing protein n=1 Tax=Neptunomonas japonica TaxID=417574 RepID=UPI00056191D0